MTGRRLLKRILVVTAGMCAFLLYVAVVQSQATPIRPDLKRVLVQPAADAAQFPLARAGWNGPENQQSPQAAPNPTLEEFGPAGTARAVRASLAAAFIPDYRAVAAIGLIILLLRRLRRAELKQRRARVLAFPEAPDEAADVA